MDFIEKVKEEFGSDVNIPKLMMIFPTIEKVFQSMYEPDENQTLHEIYALIEGAKIISEMEFNDYSRKFSNDPEARNLNLLYQFWINGITKEVESLIESEKNSKENKDITHLEALLILEQLVKLSTNLKKVKTTTLIKLLYFLRRENPKSIIENTSEYKQFNKMRARDTNYSVEAHKTYSKKAADFLQSIKLDKIANQMIVPPKKK
jgi:hypothetical protein